MFIGRGGPDLASDFGDDDCELLIDTHENRIEVRTNPGMGAGWAGVTGNVDIDAVVGQISKAFRAAGPWAAATAGKMRVASSGHAWCDISIEVPRTITGRIEVHSASGDVRIEGVMTAIALTTMSGDVRLVRTIGDLALKTASGDLIIENATGRLTAQSASGDVRITSAQFNEFQIQTVSGDVFLDATLPGDGPYRAQTASGDVRLTLRRPTAVGEEPAATLAFHTVSGDAHLTPPFRKSERWLWRAGSGDGGVRIDVTTISEDLTASLAAPDSSFVPASGPSSPRGTAPPFAPQSPAPAIVPDQTTPSPEPAPPTVSWPRGEIDRTPPIADPKATQAAGPGDAARLAVLEAVERGEIDVEEALRRLEAADSVTSA